MPNAVAESGTIAPPAPDVSNRNIGLDGSLLILLNPGRVTRHALLDMVDAGGHLGINTLAVELGDIWSALQSGKRIDTAGFARNLRDKRVIAVLGYTANGLSEWSHTTGPDDQSRSFFDELGIPHLMWWTDAPQWAEEQFALRADLQPLLASRNCHHFLKSDAAADELRDMLGWPNCYGMAIAENPERLRPAVGVRPQYDIAVITGAPPSLNPLLEGFMDQDDPNVAEISQVVAGEVLKRLSAHWSRLPIDAPRAELEALGRAWTDLRCREPLTASYRIFRRLEAQFPAASRWLRVDYRSYFDAIEALWEFGRWQRTFYVRYLARYFKVGVFGSDWSSVGLSPGGWVNHEDQPSVYALGRIALNVSQAGDEEGVAHKPFHIAASGVPMLHNNRRGLAELFAPDYEVAMFDLPREARDQAAALLAAPQRRGSMAEAALNRLRAEHTWTHRLAQMLAAAGIAPSGKGPEVSGAGSKARIAHESESTVASGSP